MNQRDINYFRRVLDHVIDETLAVQEQLTSEKLWTLDQILKAMVNIFDTRHILGDDIRDKLLNQVIDSDIKARKRWVSRLVPTMETLEAENPAPVSKRNIEYQRVANEIAIDVT